MNYAMRWFFRFFEHSEVEDGEHRCAICGLPMCNGYDIAQVLRSTFVDYDLLKMPQSRTVCTACAWYFDHQELRRYSWYLTADNAQQLAKSDILPLLATHLKSPPAQDRYYLITRSKKKHVALRAHLNAAHCANLRVNFETMLVDIDHCFIDLVTDLSALRKYHTWYEIKNDKYLPFAILRWTHYADFEHTRERVRPWLGSPQFALTEFLLTSKISLTGGEEDELS